MGCKELDDDKTAEKSVILARITDKLSDYQPISTTAPDLKISLSCPLSPTGTEGHRESLSETETRRTGIKFDNLNFILL